MSRKCNPNSSSWLTRRRVRPITPVPRFGGTSLTMTNRIFGPLAAFCMKCAISILLSKARILRVCTSLSREVSTKKYLRFTLSSFRSLSLAVWTALPRRGLLLKNWSKIKVVPLIESASSLISFSKEIARLTFWRPLITSQTKKI